MRLCGFMMVRNEEDILEASIRHNLKVLDHLCVVDHGSDDATPGILESLADEGLPIELKREEAIELRKSDVTTAHVRRILADGADLCFPIDADEFLRMPSREAFERTVSAADASLHLVMPWLTYLPAFDGTLDIVERLRQARRMTVERHGLFKVVVRRSFLDTPRAVVGSGAHVVQSRDGKSQIPHEAIPGTVAALAHVPVRSAGQFTSKVAVGHLAVLLANPADRDLSFHWQEEYQGLLAGKAITSERLASIVANYSVTPERRVDPSRVAWVEDPFLLDVGLKYTPSRPPNPLARILSFGERVAAEIARTTGGL